jgi:hypothetical protein
MLIARLIEWLEKIAKPKTIIVLVMAIIPFNALLFPWVNGRLEALSGYRLMDILFWYSPKEVFTRMAAYQSSGRTIYLISDWSIDLLYPLVYSLLAACILTMVLHAAFPWDNPLQRMQLLPLMMMVFDYLENISISLLLIQYPAQSDLLARIASTFTSLKWCFAAFSAFALAAGLIGLIVATIKPTRTSGD